MTYRAPWTENLSSDAQCMQRWHAVYRWRSPANLSSLIARPHLKICKLFSSWSPRERPLCVSLSFLPSGKDLWLWVQFLQGQLCSRSLSMSATHFDKAPGFPHYTWAAEGCGLSWRTVPYKLGIWGLHSVLSKESFGHITYYSEQRWHIKPTPTCLCEQKTSPHSSWIKALK